MPRHYHLEGEMTAPDNRVVGFAAKVETTDNGPALRELTLTATAGHALRVKDIRSVSLIEIFSNAGNAVALKRTEKRTEKGRTISYAPISDESYRIIKGTLGKPKKGPTKLSDKHLQEVADVHKVARLAGEYPVAAVAKAFGRPRDTAAKWVGKARKAKLIPKVSPGRPPSQPS